MAIKRLELIYTGRLALTDFRESAVHFATAHNLTGYVRKFPNGSVKIIAEGEEDDLNRFFHDFNEYVDDFVDHYSKHWYPATGEYGEFRLLNI